MGVGVWVYVCVVCVCLCVCVCVSLASDSSKTVTYLNHENNKYLIISETIQAMPIKFAVNIVRLKFYIYAHCHR